LKAKDLLGKHINAIYIKVSQQDNSGAIPLEKIDVEMELSFGQIISYPLHPNSKNLERSNLNPELKQIFPAKGIFNFKRKRSIFDNIEGKAIIGIWEIEDEFGEEICGLEFINGYFLVQGPMSPIGTGHADLFLFDSKSNLQKRFQGDMQLVHDSRV